VLTYLGYKDTPAHANPAVWGPLPLAGHEFVKDQRCLTCHVDGGAAGRSRSCVCAAILRLIAAHSPADPQILRQVLREPPQRRHERWTVALDASYVKKAAGGRDVSGGQRETRSRRS
jgi:hypothetical protein